jgi:hypothetical protein
MDAMTLPRAFHSRPTLDVAREYIGKSLMHVTLGADEWFIVEVEAYIGSLIRFNYYKKDELARTALDGLAASASHRHCRCSGTSQRSRPGQPAVRD